MSERQSVIACEVRLRLRPAQERVLDRWLWCLTGVWNWAVKKIEADASHGVYHSSFALKALVNGHGKKIGIPQQVLRATVAEAGMAWGRCYRRLAKRPRLKGRRNRMTSIPILEGRVFKPENGTIHIPLLGRVRFHRQDIPEGHVGIGRLVRRASGWHACLFIHAEPRQIPKVGEGAIGIDPGFSSLLTLSTGEVVEHPHELRRGAERLAQAQRGGRTRLTARLQERIACSRRDRNHKLSRRLVSENAFIAWSRDRTSSLQRIFGKSVVSAGHSQLRMMLAYKCRAGGRRFVEVDSRNSTRTCSACGAKSGPSGYAGLSVRQWGCACGAQHDRDCNAAINTLRAGLGISPERSGDGSSGIAATARWRSSNRARRDLSHT